MTDTTIQTDDGGHVTMTVDGSAGNYSIHLQKYDASGAAVGNQMFTTSPDAPQLVALAGGGYAFAKTVPQRYGATLDGYVFDASGTRIGGFGAETNGHLAASPLGGFMVTSIPGTPFNPPIPLVTQITLYDVSGHVVDQGPVEAYGSPTLSVDGDGLYHVHWGDGSLSHDLSVDPRNPPDLTPPPNPAAFQLVDDQGPQTGLVADGGATDDTTPTIRVPVTAVGAVAVTSSQSSPGEHFVAVTQADVDRGYIDVALKSSRSDGTFADGTVTVTARAEDADGIISGQTSETFTIDTRASTDHAPAFKTSDGVVVADGGTVSQIDALEANFPNGTQAQNSLSVLRFGAIYLSAQDGVKDLTVDGHAIVTNGVFTAGGFDFGGVNGIYFNDYDAASGKLSFTYGLHAPVQQAPGVDSTSFSLAAVLTDTDGDATHAQLCFRVIDDSVIANTDLNVAQIGGWAVSGNLLANDRGADGVSLIAMAGATQTSSGYTVQGQFGVLSVNANGDYSYTANAGAQPGVEHFSYDIGDNDNDRATGTLQIDVRAQASASGSVISASRPGDTLTGGSGDDTINASQGPDVITTGGGSDVVAFHDLPYSAGHVTDFAVGSDKLDLQTLFDRNAYTGDDPQGDGLITLQSDGAGGTQVYFDPDGPNSGDWPFLITTLDHVNASGLTWAQIGLAPQTFLSVTGGGRPGPEGNSGTTDFLFTVTRSGAINGTSTVHWAVVNQNNGSNGVEADDFTGGALPSGDLTFAPGETTKTVAVPVAGDTTVEADETFSFQISDASGAAIRNPQADAIIQNDDGGPAARVDIASTTVTHAEGDSGVTDFAFVVTRSGPLDQTATVNWEVHGAMGGGDVTAADFAGGVIPHGTLVFAAGEASKTIDISVAGDTTVEQDDKFFVQLLDGGAPVGNGTAYGVIVNDDGVSDRGQTINSPGPGSTINGTAGSDTINASQGPDVITTGGGGDVVAFHALPWNAGHITDFAVGTDHLDLSAIFQASGYSGTDPVADGRMSFQDDGAGGTKIYFDRDQANGGDWPFLITTLDHVSPSGLTWTQLSGATAPPPPGQSVGFTTTSVTQDEGDSGVTHFRYTVTRSGDTSGALGVHWTGQGWGNNQPTAEDFASGMMPVGGLYFAAGQTTAVIDIGVVGDTNPEQDEGFRLLIDDAPAGVTISEAAAYGLIRNDDTGDTAGTPGQVYTANPPGATVVGGAGDDTINASQGADRLTGGAGNDDFVFRDLPWSHGHITDFVVGSDKLDLSAIFQAAGYTGTDPVADGRMTFQQDNLGNTTVYFDHDQTNGGDWPVQIVTLDGVRAQGLTWAQLSTGGGSTGGGATDGGSGGSTEGQVINSGGYGSTLVGGDGDDTINAGQGPDVLSGNGGADHFVFNNLPWRAGAITDFTPGVDKLDLRPLFQAAGYSGTDPIGDHHLEFRDDGHGNTAVYFDRDDPNAGDWPFFITTLQGVTPGQIGSGDWLFR